MKRRFAGLVPKRPAQAMVPHGALRLRFFFGRGQKIGLFGGSFNPAHIGHAHVAQTARIRLGLSRIVWLVSPQNPLKETHDTMPLVQRIKGVQEIADKKDIVSDFESLIGAQFTYDTLTALKARFQGVQFVWIMGGDSLAGFHQWRGWRQIARLMPICIVSRPGSLMKSRFSPTAQILKSARISEASSILLARKAPPAWVYLEAPLHPQSSTNIRMQKKLMSGLTKA